MVLSGKYTSDTTRHWKLNVIGQWTQQKPDEFHSSWRFCFTAVAPLELARPCRTQRAELHAHALPHPPRGCSTKIQDGYRRLFQFPPIITNPHSLHADSPRSRTFDSLAPRHDGNRHEKGQKYPTDMMQTPLIDAATVAGPQLKNQWLDL